MERVTAAVAALASALDAQCPTWEADARDARIELGLALAAEIDRRIEQAVVEYARRAAEAFTAE